MMQPKHRTFHAGEIGGYKIGILDDIVSVWRDSERVALRAVEGLDTFMANAKDFKLGWARLEGGDEVLYLYDKGDDCFGYALNLSAGWCSEWGYAPFRK